MGIAVTVGWPRLCCGRYLDCFSVQLGIMICE